MIQQAFKDSNRESDRTANNTLVPDRTTNVKRRTIHASPGQDWNSVKFCERIEAASAHQCVTDPMLALFFDTVALEGSPETCNKINALMMLMSHTDGLSICGSSYFCTEIERLLACLQAMLRTRVTR